MFTDQNTLSQHLADLPVEKLREIAKECGIKTTNKKAGLVVELTKSLPEPARVRRELAQVDEPTLYLFALMRAAGGSILAGRAKRELLQRGLITPTPAPTRTYGAEVPYAGNAAYKRRPAFEDVIARLEARGMIFRPLGPKPTYGLRQPGRTIFLPYYAQPLISEIALPELPQPGKLEPRHVRPGNSVDFLRDVSNYLRYVRDQGGMGLSTLDTLYKNDLKALAELVTKPVQSSAGHKETDNGYLFFLRRLLQAAELLQGLGVVQAAEETDLFFRLDWHGRLSRLYAVWRDSTCWNGLRHLPSYSHGCDIRNRAHPRLNEARKTVLQCIAELGGADWVPAEVLIARLQDRDYGFLLSPRQFVGYAYRDSVSASPYAGSNNIYGITFKGMTDEADGWDKVEGAYINHVMAGPLYWMGLVDLAYSTPPPDFDAYGNHLIAGYRLTEQGRALLLGAELPKAVVTQVGGLIVQPNFEILVMQPIPMELLMALDAFAIVKDSQQHVTTYQLTRESVYRGQQGQWPVERILAYLSEHCTQPVPDNIRRSLEEWEALYNRIVIWRRAVLVETADAATAERLRAAIPQAQPLTPTVLRYGGPFAELETRVRSGGFIPLVARENDDGSGGSVRIDDDGAVTFLHAAPNIFARQALADVSVPVEPAEPGGPHRRLLPLLVKGVVPEGQGYAALSARLQHLTGGPLLETLVVRLKAWSEYYGRARQARLILFEFRDVAARDELCRDAALVDKLIPFAGNRPLATVAAEHLETVRSLLAERGVPVEEQATL